MTADDLAFGVLRGAVRRAVKDARLHVLDGDPRIGSSTLLGFTVDSPRSPQPDLAQQVTTWLDDVLPDLVTATPSGLVAVEEALCRRLLGLAAAGVATFRFRDVIDPFKTGVRQWHDAVWGMEAGEDGDGDVAALVRRVRPDDGYEERQFFGALVECVSASLPLATRTKKSGGQLEKYWHFLRSLVSEERSEEVPSQRKIGELLGIHRTRIPEFQEILGRELERCRKSCRLPLGQGGEA